jgi:hypothetical protein
MPQRLSLNGKPFLSCECPVDFYERARASVLGSPHSGELRWQARVLGTPFTETDLLREAAWVVLCSGFRESVVRGAFDFISLCYCDFECARAIVEAGESCVATARARFRNERKLRAISSIAGTIDGLGFEVVRRQIEQDPQSLMRFPWIGPITWAHLAKNLGFDLAKEDRHLVALARRLGFSSGEALCRFISDRTGEPTACVDIVLWRHIVMRGSDSIGIDVSSA